MCFHRLYIKKEKYQNRTYFYIVRLKNSSRRRHKKQNTWSPPGRARLGADSQGLFTLSCCWLAGLSSADILLIQK